MVGRGIEVAGTVAKQGSKSKRPVYSPVTYLLTLLLNNTMESTQFIDSNKVTILFPGTLLAKFQWLLKLMLICCGGRPLIMTS